MTKLCPVCEASIVIPGRDDRYEQRQLINCLRCGRFTITDLAIKALIDAHFTDSTARVRLSHQVRLAGDQDRDLLVREANVQEFLERPFPTAEVRRNLLLQLISKLAADDGAEVARLGKAYLSEVVARVGVGSEHNLVELVLKMRDDGLLRLHRSGESFDLSITLAGHERLKAIQHQPPEKVAVATLDKSTDRPASRPDWVDAVEDEPLRGLLGEVYSAVSYDLRTIALMGARAAFDRMMDIKLGRDAGNFAAKINAMKDGGHLTDRDTEILGPMIDAGSAAAHRAWMPSAEIVVRVLGELQYKHYDWFARDAAAATVKEGTPQRPRRS